jgi:hypothetical protein
MDHAAKMLELAATQALDRMDPSPEMIEAFEARFALKLPDDYRAFVLEHGAMHVDAEVDFQEPTPHGEAIAIERFFGFYTSARPGDLEWATDIVEGHGLCVPIAESPLGHLFVLMCEGPQRGNVLLRDDDQRHLWPDREFTERFPELAPSIREYLARRRADDLPAPLSGTPGWYFVGSSFDDFLARCRRDEETPSMLTM